MTKEQRYFEMTVSVAIRKAAEVERQIQLRKEFSLVGMDDVEELPGWEQNSSEK